MRWLAFPLVALVVTSCATTTHAPDDEGEGQEHRWDSAKGNPTHPTHSIYAEYAIRTIGDESPDVRRYGASIVQGANLELHELRVDEEFESLRQEIGGSNWAADRPEILWQRARASYAAGDRARAYLYVGIILHYVQDMGGPAHAFHVIHQNRPWNWDNVEMLGFHDFHGDLDGPPPASTDPRLADPVSYIEWSAARTREHFQRAFPGATYHRTFIPGAYQDMGEQHWAFLRERQTSSARATAFALRAAAVAFGAAR